MDVKIIMVVGMAVVVEEAITRMNVDDKFGIKVKLRIKDKL